MFTFFWIPCLCVAKLFLTCIFLLLSCIFTRWVAVVVCLLGAHLCGSFILASAEVWPVCITDRDFDLLCKKLVKAHQWNLGDKLTFATGRQNQSEDRSADTGSGHPLITARPDEATCFHLTESYFFFLSLLGLVPQNPPMDHPPPYLVVVRRLEYFDDI